MGYNHRVTEVIKDLTQRGASFQRLWFKHLQFLPFPQTRQSSVNFSCPCHLTVDIFSGNLGKSKKKTHFEV